MTVPPETDLSRFRPIEVIVEGPSREDFEYAFRKFKSLFQREKVISKLKEQSSFEKPSDKKRRKQRDAQERNWIAKMREEQINSGVWEKIQKKRLQAKLTKEEKRAKESLNVKE